MNPDPPVAADKLRARLRSVRGIGPVDRDVESIAIIGLSCRFPGAKDAFQYWNLLRDGIDAITEVPSDRWKVDEWYDPDPSTPGKTHSRWGGFITQIDHFDAAYFQISPREAEWLDPQQRVMLELAVEALEDGCQPIGALAGSNTGVFIGTNTTPMESYVHTHVPVDQWGIFTNMGKYQSIIANRISFGLDLHGPSMVVDTACSSSMVAVHLACSALRNGDCDLALAGGVRIMLQPHTWVVASKTGMLAADGRCKAFDSRADGFVRSEGGGFVVLKPLSKAIADGDPIYATILASAINEDGRGGGLTVPNQLAQEAMLREAYRRARVEVDQVQYVETHGTGTPLGDPIEAQALGKILGRNRPSGSPCLIGSVKSNIGHLEAAAGVAGIIKVALSMKHRKVPASLHFQKPNPHISFETLGLRVQTELGPWPDEGRPLIAGVSSFGIGGANGHLVMQQAPPPRPEDHRPSSRQFHVLPLSARSPEAVLALSRAYAEYLGEGGAGSNLELADLSHTAALRRSHQAHRLAIVARSSADAAQQLESFQRGEPGALACPKVPRTESEAGHKLAFVFSGQGPQWWKMGRQLLEQEPVFREVMGRCDELIKKEASWSLLEHLRADQSSSRMSETQIAQPAIFALQVGLTALWRSWGITPRAVVGHSVGEVAAAHLAGVLTLEDAIHLVLHRGRLMHRAAGRGKMASVALPAAEARKAISGFEDRVTIAAINSPRSVVLSGQDPALREITEKLQKQGVFTRFLPVEYPFHSPQMKEYQPELLSALHDLQPRAATLPIVSTLTGRHSDGEKLGPQYWAEQLGGTVAFASAIDTLAEEGYDLYLEIGPHPVLAPAIKECLSHRACEGVVLPSLHREHDDLATLLRSLAELYTLGHDVDWGPLHQGEVKCVPLPTYPWQRKRFWPTISSPQLLQPTHQPSAPAAQVASWLYEVRWERAAAPPVPAGAGPSGLWLVFGGHDATTNQIRSELEKKGATTIVVRPGLGLQRIGRGDYELSPERPEQFADLLGQVLKEPAALKGVVHLWGLANGPPGDGSAGAELQQAQTLGCESVAYLVRAIVARGLSVSPRLVLVTAGAQRVADETDRLSLGQAPLWGLGKVIGRENPELRCTLIDLSGRPSSIEASALVDELGADARENLIALRANDRFVARLTAHERAPRPRSDVTLRSDASYLITGGLGGLGRLVAGWMVKRGARNLVLIGRSGGTADAVRTLEQAGARVLIQKADVADEAQLALALKTVAKEMPPLRGIVHAAGAIKQGPVAQIDAKDFRALTAAKIAGTWNLHRLTIEQPLDFFVLFSSAASLLTGQGSYAAGNAFLDAFSHDQRARGRPGLSINWGPWKDIGIAAEHDRYERTGWGTLSTELGLQALELALGEGVAQVAVLSNDWPRWRKSHPEVGNWPFVSHLFLEPKSVQNGELSPGKSQSPSPVAPSLGYQVRSASTAERRSLLEGYLRESVAEALRMSRGELELQHYLVELGLDSVVAIELKNRFEADLGMVVPVVELLNPEMNLLELSKRLLSQLGNS